MEKVPMLQKNSPGWQIEIARSSDSSVAFTNAWPSLSTSPTRNIVEQSPWKPLRYTCTSTHKQIE